MDLTTDDQRLRLYLLGELPEEEQTRLEQRLVTDRAFFAQLEVAEDEIVDHFVRGELAPSENRRVVDHFLAAPERQQKLRFARALRQYVADVSTAQGFTAPEIIRTRDRWWRFRPGSFASNQARAFAVGAVLLLIFGGAWLLFQNAQLRSQLERLRVDQAREEQQLRDRVADLESSRGTLSNELENERLKREQIEQEIAKLKQTGSAADLPSRSFAALALLPGLLRDGEISSVEISPKVAELRLQLALDSQEYRSYRAEVQTDDGKAIWTRGGIAPAQTTRGRALVIAVPTKVLGKGDRRVIISGAIDGGYEKAGTYYFRVLK